MRNNKNVIVIVGPTCSGKTTLSIKLAEIFNSEIISADSRQIYKYLNIGTAKPTDDELKRIKHHFIDFLNPDEEFNVSQFEKNAEEIIERLIEKNKIPIVVGGSGLYIKAVIDGITRSADTNSEIRNDLLNQKREKGIEYLYNKLKVVDPVSAKKIHPQNWKRVIRALEVFYLTGKPIWQHHENQSKKNKNVFFQIGLNWKREVLYKNINERVNKMIEAGLVDEVKNILNSGYDKKLNSLNTVGYKEIIKYIESEISLDLATELIKRNTRRYAKRQMTWFGKDKRISWFNVNDYHDLDIVAEKIINTLNV